MNYRGVLFDWNGTIFFDSDKHKKAWQLFLPEKIGREVSEDEIRTNCLGQTNSEILRRYFGEDLSDDEVYRLAEILRDIDVLACSGHLAKETDKTEGEND